MSDKDVNYQVDAHYRKISLLSVDAAGSDAFSNVEKIRRLRKEIHNLETYGVPRPGIVLILRKLAATKWGVK